jgi:hypothetical protein
MTFDAPMPQRNYAVMQSPRALLWARLETAHARLGLAPPTATLTMADLEAEVERVERQASEREG